MSLILTDSQAWAIAKAYYLSSEITRMTFNDEIDVDFGYDGEITVLGAKPGISEPTPVEVYADTHVFKETYGV